MKIIVKGAMSLEDVISTLVRTAVTEGFRENRPVIRAEVEAALAHGTGPQAVLTTKEAAKPAGVTPRTIQKWVREGPLGGRPYRFRLADVERARDRQVIDDSVLNLEERANDLLARRKRGEAP